MTDQAKSSNLHCLINPTFSKVNRLFVLSFKVNEDEGKNDRTSFSEYYTPKVEIKDLKVLTDGKKFF